MDSSLRILDAAANRAREALRVLEDAARFVWDDADETARLKNLRHDLAAVLAALPMDRALAARNTKGDVGTAIKTPAELHRSSLHQVLAANAKRLTEALRSMEEFAKLHSAAAAGGLERMRYQAYSLEQTILSRARASDAEERFRQVRLYVLLTESICAKPWERMLEEILAAAGHCDSPDAAGFPLAIQLREKSLADVELLRRAKMVVEKCHAAGALAIINDRPDVALLAGADGVHLGQGDLPVAECRQLLGPEMIVGISTEKIEQAHQGASDGATYIAVGPMFPTTTKEKPRIAGPAYASDALREIKKPVVAIGGITPANVSELAIRGVPRVAVSSCILQDDRPAIVIRRILDALPAGNA